MFGPIFELCFGIVAVYITIGEARDGFNRDMRERFQWRTWWYFSITARLVLWICLTVDGLARLIFGAGIIA